jgi:hypothetical protein
MNLPSCTRCLLGIYMLILMVLFAGMITGAVFAGKSDGLEVIKAPMLTSLKSYDPSTLEDNTEQAWDGMQIAVSEYRVFRKSVPSYGALSTCVTHDLRFDLRFGACFIMSMQGNALS